MQIKLYTIPVVGGEKLTEELNAFLRSKKILQTENHIVQSNQGAFWCFCIKYIEDSKGDKKFTRKEKVDYKTILDEATFQRFSEMRQIRKALPIGNLTSQYFANHYLCGLDHFIKEKLHCKAYVRYMDDLIIWHQDKNELKKIYQEIQFFVKNKLSLTLKPELLNQSKKGLPFLGYLLFPHYTRLKQQSKQRFIKKYRAIEKAYHTGKSSPAECQRKILPLIAFTQHANAKKFRSQLMYS